MFGLPAETIEFIKSGAQLDLSALEEEVQQGIGDAKMVPFDRLKKSSMEYLVQDAVEFIGIDEDAYEDGHWVVEFVPLLDEDWGGHTLVWLPQVSTFGQLDEDHGAVFAFKGVTWAQLAETPEKYLAGLFDWGDGEGWELDPTEETSLPFVKDDDS